MENNQFNILGNNGYSQSKTNVQSFMTGVFSWMFLALIITSVTAWWFASDSSLIGMLVSEEGKMSLLGWVVMLSPIGFVLLMSFGFNKFSYSTLLILFLTYSAIVGVSLSFILLVYTLSSIFKTFVITAAMFGTMAVVGYTTKTDLTAFGRIMMMGLIGIIIATLINFFMHSSTLDYIISYVGVAVFTGLTAYDVQKLKMIGQGTTYGDESSKKLAIMGALTLYLDFINLFLMLLRLFGDRRN
ncbi:MAG: Bax inhibitor-1/YccA family protein [Bacteroidia bacterium]|nr:Bax inhibitor-1/YccA family protein [Bacteroidia bacterium]MCZ2247484.1 Bax inhibitor-1/YccA family protein [Bacteroidia bacterium]